MSFSYPLGFLILLFIPVLIILYILKNKFTEQTVSSTFLWKLSEKFLKRKRPISKIYGILSLILQCLVVAVIAIMVSGPAIRLPNQARDFCFIIDSSGSMGMKNGDKTRYDMAKDEICDIIDSSVEGSTFTLISCEDKTNVVYEGITNKTSAQSQLRALSISSIDSNCVDALPLAQSYFDNNKSLSIYLATDKEYTTNPLINLIKVNSNSHNYALENITYDVSVRKLTLSGNVKTYNITGDVKISLYVDDEFKAETTITTNANNENNFNFSEITIGETYDSIKVVIDTADDLSYDNEYIIYNLVQEKYNKVLLVSDNPLYLENMLNALGSLDLTVISEKDYYPTQYGGYGLYIFDCYNPNELPKDGSVWLINVEGVMNNYGFNYQDSLDFGNVGRELELNERSNPVLSSIKDGLIDETLYITQYQKYGLYNNFDTILSCEGNPVLFVGTTNSGNREVVFGFDLHNSNLPLSMNYITLIRNLINYSFPTILDTTSYVAGDSLMVNVLAGCSSIEIIAPNGSSMYLDTTGAIAQYILNESGSYTVNVTINGKVNKFLIYSAYPESESNIISQPETTNLSISGTPEAHYGDGIYKSLVYLFIALGVIFIADWVVYCREQYKLR